MKSMCRMMLLLLMLLPVGRAMAADETGNARDEDHAALRALLGRVTQAVNGQNIDALTGCFTKQFVFTTVDQSVLTDTLSIRNYYDRMLRGKNSPITAYKVTPKADVLTVFVDGNTGYCHGTSDDAYTLRKGGRTVHMQCRWTATVVKEDGEWKMAAVHTGVNVMDNTVLRVKTLPWWRKCLITIGIGKYPGEK